MTERCAEAILSIKCSPKEQLLVEIPAKLDMYHRKYGRMDYFMDTSYYKCLLQKMACFNLKTSWGVPTVPDRVRRGENEAADGGSLRKKKGA